MLAKQISTVRSSEGIRELYSYVHPPEDETCSSRRSKDDKFRDVVCGLMGDIANTIREDVEIIREGVPRLVSCRDIPTILHRLEGSQHYHRNERSELLKKLYRALGRIHSLLAPRISLGASIQSGHRHTIHEGRC